ncbi:surfactant protein B [Oesophagostomum dentatum]|uniref:Surfactant protein B n=1 Tax=Oesophagostomum dentatum TaxID=61180 RepID=A0A0B1T543_OESDE|nr:surfactant protein B [Oesophagostomum dentatum]
MRSTVLFFLVLCVSVVCAEKKKKPLCEMCENVIEYLDKVLQKGEDMEKSLHVYCRTDCPEFLKMYCEKIDQSLKYIIEKLKDHGTPEQICTDIHFCVA